MMRNAKENFLKLELNIRCNLDLEEGMKSTRSNMWVKKNFNLIFILLVFTDFV